MIDVRVFTTASVNEQELIGTYNATPSYQQAVVSAVPLNVIPDERESHPTVSSASQSPSVDLRQQQNDAETTEDDYYSEIKDETGLPPPPPPPPLSPPSEPTSSPPLPAAAATVTSSNHVTEMSVTLIKQTYSADATAAVYSALDAETLRERDVTASPSVYQPLGDQSATAVRHSSY